MTTSLLEDAFAHHVWATDRLLASCADLTPEQLAATAPGTYGSILDTLHHLVDSDRWYLTFFRDSVRDFDTDAADVDEMRAQMADNGRLWKQVLASDPDPDTDIDEREDGTVLHSPVGVRLAQVVHHGTDHRSHVCTVLTTLGIEPPGIDVWDYARASGRERFEEESPA